MEEKSKDGELYNDTWEVPKEEFFAKENSELSPSSNYAQTPSYLDPGRSNIERIFEDFLNKKGKDKIQWWWKNKDYGQEYFGIKYKDEANEVRTFYPDYLVQFQNGQLGIFDTKGGITAETAKPKANALQAYITVENSKGKNLIGGILKLDKKDIWHINQSENYVNYQKEDWEVLSDFWSGM